jgi:tRNA threonylcarbamoyladenosine biosynthesis protein TsaE
MAPATRLNHEDMTTSGNELTLHSHSLEATLAIGRALGQAAEPGLVVALIGPLGAGKTQLVRGVAEGLEVADPRVVSSPTFVLIQEYEGRLPIFHFDTYRLRRPEQFTQLGPEELFESDGVCLVEWADRVIEFLPSDRLEIQIGIQGPDCRLISMRATGGKAMRVMMRFMVTQNPPA